VLSFVTMPEYLLPFLKCNMQSGSENYRNLYNAIYDEQGFRSLFFHAFQEFDEKLEPKRVVSALGWESFRNRFCSMFVHYLQHDKFPKKTSEVPIAHIIDFENKFRRFSVDGHGRLFMLGLYFTFLDIQNNNDHFKTFMKSEDLYKLIAKSKIKELRIDWLIIVLYNLMEYVPLDKIEERIDEEEAYLNFYREFDDQRQKDITQSYLAYASSIKDDYFFLNSIFDED
jgi:hypothetical protein